MKLLDQGFMVVKLKSPRWKCLPSPSFFTLLSWYVCIIEDHTYVHIHNTPNTHTPKLLGSPHYLVAFVLLNLWFSENHCPLYSVFIFWLSFRYLHVCDFSIIISLVLCRGLMSYLHYVCLFMYMSYLHCVCLFMHSGHRVQHILCCVSVLFLFVLCTQYC